MNSLCNKTFHCNDFKLYMRISCIKTNISLPLPCPFLCVAGPRLVQGGAAVWGGSIHVGHECHVEQVVDDERPLGGVRDGAVAGQATLQRVVHGSDPRLAAWLLLRCVCVLWVGWGEGGGCARAHVGPKAWEYFENELMMMKHLMVMMIKRTTTIDIRRIWSRGTNTVNLAG